MEEKDRVVRLFVSSTFRDMFFDREVLVKQVFPEINRFCRARGVDFTGIDLRTGVTAEQSENGMTLNLCLQEVDRCRPYFLCMLGERYGWHISSAGDILLEKTFDNTIKLNPKYSWINSFRDRSVTELEIRHGVLNGLSRPDRALFFLRQSDYSFHLINEGLITTDEMQSYESENDICREKLLALKEEIVKSGAPVTLYRHHEDVGELVLAQLKQIISEDFPEVSCTDHIVAERREHAAFAASRCKVYICKQAYYDALNRYIVSDMGTRGGVFVVYGPSGVGKSSLVANWTNNLISKRNESIYHLHTHFVGCSSASADPVTMLHRLVLELLNIPSPTLHAKNDHVDASSVPSIWEDLVMMLPQVLADVSSHMNRVNADLRSRSSSQDTFHPKVVVIVLDAVNQLTDSHLAEQMSWLPNTLPPFIKIVISAIDLPQSFASTDTQQVDSSAPAGPARKDIKRDHSMAVPIMEKTPSLRHVGSTMSTAEADFVDSGDAQDMTERCLLVEALDAESVRDIAVQYMKEFGKTLAEQQLRMLSACEQTKNPLFLRTVLEEVRVWGHFEQLDSQIGRYLSKDTIGKLFDSVLSRMERDYNCSPKHSTLVQDALRALSCCRTGLSEFELQEIVAAPRYLFSGFFLSIQQSLTNRNGLLHFFHDYLRVTVEEKYLPDDSDRCNTHAILARYFAGTKDTYLSNRSRNLEELLWQLQNSGKYAALRLLLQLPSIAVHLYDTNRVDLFRMWRKCSGDHEGYAEAGRVYREETVLMLLGAAGEGGGREGRSNRSGEDTCDEVSEDVSLISHIIELERNVVGELFMSEKVDMARKISAFLVQSAQYAAAEEVLDIAQSKVESEHERISMNIDRAGLYLSLCKYNEGITICEQMLEQHEGDQKAHLQCSPSKKFRQDESSSGRCVMSPVVFSDVQYMLAKLYSGNGQFQKADSLFAAVQTYRQREFGENRQQTADVLNDIAKHKFSQRMYSEALELYERVLAIKRITIGEKSTSFIRTVRDIGMFYHDLADYDIAFRYFINALEVTERNYGPHHPAVADILNEMAFTKYMQQKSSGEFNDVTQLYERALRIREASFGEYHGDIANTINHLANVYRAKLEAGDVEAGVRAIELYKRAKAIKEHVFPSRHPEVLLSRNNLANMLLMEKKFEEAAAEHEEVLRIRQELHGVDHLQTATSYKNCGLAQLGLKNYEKSLEYHLTAMRIRATGFGEEHPKTAESCACVGDVYVAYGRPMEAVPYYQRAIHAWNKKMGPGNSNSELATSVVSIIERGENVTEAVAKFS
jgi:tetratricopeptide (TPR) repeat protein